MSNDKMDMIPCIHLVSRGPRKGQECGEISIRGDRCQTHLILTEPDKELGTCKYQFVRSDRKGYFCPLIAIDDEGYCDTHTRITASADAGVSHCSHLFKTGYRVGCYCTDKPIDDGFCWKHSPSTKSLDTPQVVHRPDESANNNDSERTTCHHKFVRGKYEGRYCAKIALDWNEFCKTHQPKIKKTRKPRAQRERCAHTIMRGFNKGERCQKASFEDGYCRKHLKFSTRCHHVVVIEKRCTRQAGENGYCTNHHDRNDNGNEVESDPDFVDEGSDQSESDE
jgi:hypothetical protein